MTEDMDQHFARLRGNLVAFLKERTVTHPRVDDTAISKILTTQHDDGTWQDVDYQDAKRAGWSPFLHLARTFRLAQHWHLSRDQALLEATHKALYLWADEDFQSDNWWVNQIGTPAFVGETALLLGDAADKVVHAVAHKVLSRSGTFKYENGATTPWKWTGANLVWMCTNMIYRAALTEDVALAVQVRDLIRGEIHVANLGEEGVQVDGSFHQHGPQLMNGSYGIMFLANCLSITQAVNDTPWHIGKEGMRVLTDLFLDGYKWMIRGRHLNPSTCGRNITRPLVQDGGPYLLAQAEALLATTPWRREECERLVAELTRHDGAGAPGITGNRMFYRSDFMVHQGEASAISVLMSSTRTVRAECVIDEGKRSHHLADGATFLFQTGDEYQKVYPVWDWQKIPGTTCIQTEAMAPQETVYAYGSTANVGGVSDGQFGACTQELAEGTLHARKSWFFGPEYVVCLGTDISAAEKEQVVTTLDQVPLRGDVIGDQLEPDLARETEIRLKLRWLSHGTRGYLFPEPALMSLRCGQQSGAWSLIGAGSADPVVEEVFLAYWDHGRGPKNAAYAYVMMGGVTPTALQALSEAPPWVILRNEPLCQAVWHHLKGGGSMMQVVCHSAGQYFLERGTLIVDRPCMIQGRTWEDGKWKIQIADIRQSVKACQVSWKPIGQDVPAVEGVVQFPSGVSAGKSISLNC